MSMARILPLGALLTLSSLAAEWQVLEFASLEDYENRRSPKRVLRFSPVITDTSRGPEINLKNGKDDEIISILNPSTGVGSATFRRNIASVILKMPCQEHLKITTIVAPFPASTLDRLEGTDPKRDPRRILILRVDSCIIPRPAACTRTYDPQLEISTYEELIRELANCANILSLEWRAWEAEHKIKYPNSPGARGSQ